MVRFILTAAVALTAAFAVPSMASASSTVTLKMPRDITSQFPSVSTVKATNLPAKTNGYAPRALVAETAVGQLQYQYGMTGRFPVTVHPMGARWDGGVWRVRYRIITTADGAYGKFTIRNGSQVLRFDGGS